MIGDESSACFIWSREEDYIFEHGLATYPEDLEDRWERIAANIPGKSVEDIKQHYEILIDDVNRIESGCVPLPCYESFQDGFTGQVGDKGTGKKGGSLGQFGANGSKASRAEQERRKGTAWSTEEHKLFLLGLEKYGRGDWRSISRNCVVTRTPTQVASHAQKYFIRLKSVNKDRRRPSIYDVTNGNNNDVSVPQGPIPGHVDGSFGKPSKQLSPSPEALSGVGPYVGTESPLGIGLHGGTVIGQPVGGHLISTTGTPATLPQPTHMVNLPQAAHMAYGVRPLISGQMVMAAPVNMGPMTYSVPSSYS